MPVIQLELDSSGAISSLQKFDNTIDATAAKTDTSFSKMRKGLNDFGKVAGVALVAASAAVVAFGLKALESGARMEETQNKYDVVFDGMIDKSNEWVQELRKNYAVSEKAAKEYLASTKAIIDGTNLETEAAGRLSNQVVLLAQDLASFHDKSPEQAVNAMTSALTGEYEAMKQFGVVIKSSDVVLRAMTDNQLASKDAVTQAMQAQAAYALILERSGKAQGDTIRSQESYTFQLKQAKAIIEDLVTAIGVKLLPVGTKILKMFNTWAIEQDGVTRAVNASIEVVRFFDNGIRGLMLIAKGATVAIAYGFDVVAKAVALLLTPLSLAIDGMMALGLIDSNPIKELTAFTGDFLQAQIEGFQATYEGIEKQNQMYDSLKETVKSTSAVVQEAGATSRDEAISTAATIDSTWDAALDQTSGSYETVKSSSTATGNKAKTIAAEVAKITEGQWQNSLDSVGSAYDTVADKATAAGNAAQAAAAKVADSFSSVGGSDANISYISEGSSSSSGGGTSNFESSLSDPALGEEGYSRPGYGRGTTPGSGTTITNIFSQQISRSDVSNIITEQQRAVART